MFKDFSKAVHARYKELAKNELFVTDAEGIFERYLSFFPEGSNPLYKTRTEHDCVTCKHFIRRLGSLVGIKDGKTVSVWDDLDLVGPYKEVADLMQMHVRSLPIKTVFRTRERSYGTEHNYDKDAHRYEHFFGEVSNLHYCIDPDTKRSEQEAIYQVMKRGLTEIKIEHIVEVLSLIESNGLYRGEEHKPAIRGFLQLLESYNSVVITKRQADVFIWSNLTNRNARFRNTVIGTLLTDLAEGKSLDDAVKAFETKVAPMNYKRPTAVITQKMVESAVETLNGLGLGGAIYRRFAKISDVSVNDVLFVDNDVRSQMKDGVALLLEGSIKRAPFDPKKAISLTEIEFVRDILPDATSIELYLENKHTGNFVTLTGGDGPERLFKWNNNFAWAYDGDVTDSVKQRVKAAGGNILAKLRVSLSWFNTDDLDLHAMLPGGRHVFFGDKGGILDVDMNVSTLVRNPVENLAFNDLRNGQYKIWVNQYRRRETTDTGFSIEVESKGQLHQYSYPKAVTGDVVCFVLTVEHGQLIHIQTELTGGNASQEKWGVKTEQLTPVAAVLNSPNHWTGAGGIGAKHLIFALKGCKSDVPVRGIFNEYLRGDLDKHRKVFEVLGSKTKCSPSGEQVSGVGFTSARGDSVTVVVDGRRSYTVSF